MNPYLDWEKSVNVLIIMNVSLKDWDNLSLDKCVSFIFGVFYFWKCQHISFIPICQCLENENDEKNEIIRELKKKLQAAQRALTVNIPTVILTYTPWRTAVLLIMNPLAISSNFYRVISKFSKNDCCWMNLSSVLPFFISICYLGTKYKPRLFKMLLLPLLVDTIDHVS